MGTNSFLIIFHFTNVLILTENEFFKIYILKNAPAKRSSWSQNYITLKNASKLWGILFSKFIEFHPDFLVAFLTMNISGNSNTQVKAF